MTYIKGGRRALPYPQHRKSVDEGIAEMVDGLKAIRRTNVELLKALVEVRDILMHMRPVGSRQIDQIGKALGSITRVIDDHPRE